MSSVSSPTSDTQPAAGAASASAALSKESALIYLFEKMGVPLINAISAVHMWQNMDQQDQGGDNSDAVQYATDLATLLNRTVSLSTALSDKLELSLSEDQKHRLDIAAVSTLMIAHQYALMARVPADQDIPKITSSMESVLSFADYFASTEEMRKQTGRSADALLVDCIDASTPMVQTISRFSFGRNEKTLLGELLGALGERVDTLTKAFGQDMKDRNLTSEKMQIFKGCAQLLTLCYESEMNALIQNSTTDKGSGAAAITNEAMDQALSRVWESFDSRVALLRTVLGYVNEHFTGENAGRRPAKTAKAAPQQAKTSPQTDDTAPAAASPIQAVLDRAEGSNKPKTENSDNNTNNEDSGEEGNDGNFNPMSFFTGK